MELETNCAQHGSHNLGSETGLILIRASHPRAGTAVLTKYVAPFLRLPLPSLRRPHECRCAGKEGEEETF